MQRRNNGTRRPRTGRQAAFDQFTNVTFAAVVVATLFAVLWFAAVRAV